MEGNFLARSLMHFVVKKTYNDQKKKLLLIFHNKMT